MAQMEIGRSEEDRIGSRTLQSQRNSRRDVAAGTETVSRPNLELLRNLAVIGLLIVGTEALLVLLFWLCGSGR